MELAALDDVRLGERAAYGQPFEPAGDTLRARFAIVVAA